MDRQEKREQIEAIDDEVSGLHPLLHQLLKQLDNVTYVEYTHGPHEMGADFVIERTDPAIGETYHIGVVAKTDKILQNFIDIERQIEECGLKRYIREGKQEVRLQEVWVITTKSTSQNAKQKISEKYSNRKIHFFGSDWLVDQVEKGFPYYWHHLPTATGSYLANLARNMAELDAQTTLLNVPTASAKYIELDIELHEAEPYKKKGAKPAGRLVNFAQEVLLNEVTLLEADMGFGKSKVARRIVSDLSNPATIKKNKVLPVFQPFVAFAAKEYPGLVDRLRALVGDACFEEARKTGHTFLFVLDGIDESAGDIDRYRELVGNLLREVRETNYVRVLLTSRPFKLLEEVPEVVKITKRYRIRPLSIKKLVQFVREVCEQINLPTKLYQDLTKSELFRQLPQNPIAAALLTNLLAQTKQDLPSNLTELYSKSMEYMLGRWDEKRGLALSTEKLFKTCERVARGIARYMLDNKLVYLSAAEVRTMIETFLKDRNINVSADDVWNYLMDRSYLFGRLSETDTIFFRHRSFGEYLYARDAYEQRDLPIDENAFHPYWTDVFFFYIGLLAECPDLLRKLVAMQPQKTQARWIRILQLGNYLLAGYQSPYSVIEESLHILLKEFAQLYLDIKNGVITSPFRDLSEMKLLWLFAIFTKHAFGYEFFHKALPLAMAELDDDKSLSREENLYALFLAACALGDLDDKCGYRFLLERNKTDALPLAISLSLAYEVQAGARSFSKDPVIKHHEKKLKQLLTPQKGERQSVRQRLDELYDKPLGATGSKNVSLDKE